MRHIARQTLAAAQRQPVTQSATTTHVCLSSFFICSSPFPFGTSQLALSRGWVLGRDPVGPKYALVSPL